MSDQEGNLSRWFGKVLVRFTNWKEIEPIVHAIDPEFYAAQVKLPLPAKRRLCALHYYYFGEKQGLKPAESFDPNAYKSLHPDVAQSDFGLFYHFITFGQHESRRATHFNYREWLKEKEAIWFDESAINGSPGIVFSIVMPVYKANIEHLRSAIDSVQNQSYQNWELCLVDDGSQDDELTELLKSYESDQIKIQINANNSHIASATNDAIGMSEGNYIVFMDQDDELHVRALSEVASCLEKNPSLQLIYSDEDKMDGQGNRHTPHFKSDFNFFQLLHQNYINHLTVLAKPLVTILGGLRNGFNGSQDHDLLLRAAIALRNKTGLVAHIPKVLYHWRAVEGSTAMNLDEKNYAIESGIKAIKSALTELGLTGARVRSINNSGVYHIIWPKPHINKVSVLIPTKDLYDQLSRCIEGLLTTNWPVPFEVIVINNESSDHATLEYLAKINTHENIRVVDYPGAFNFSAANNLGAKHATGDVLLLLNNDIEITEPTVWINALLGPLLFDDVAVTGARLLYPDHTIQHAGVILGIGGVAGHAFKYRPSDDWGYFGRAKLTMELSAVTAACFAIRKDVFDEVGQFNEEDLPVAFNDIDLCLRVKEAGYKIVYCANAELIHFESKSRGAEDSPEKITRFNKEIEYMNTKWQEALKSDPYYSENLSLKNEQFEILNLNPGLQKSLISENVDEST